MNLLLMNNLIETIGSWQMDKSIQNVNETYDQIALLYNLLNKLYFFGKDEKLRSWIVKNLNLKVHSKVLNLCSGTGLDIPVLLRKLNQETVTGVDLPIQMLRQTKHKQQTRMINLVRADIAHLPFRNKAFDAIMVSFCLTITQHIRQLLKRHPAFSKILVE